jgi:tryptophanyl-tRNA synthetase
LFCNSNIIPVGEDQLPVIEQANEIVSKFNSIYGKTFRRINPVLSSVPRLIGIDGNAKASKSLGNAIYLSDNSSEIKRKVMMMYTDPGHIHVNDPGKVEGNVVFTYLDIFDKDKVVLKKLKEDYKKGGLGDVVIKKRLITILEDLIGPIREKRNELAKNPKEIDNILKEGIKKARITAKETMERVRKAIKIDYF